MIISEYALLIIAILFSVTGQLLFKYGMMRLPNFTPQQLFSLIANPPVIAGLLSYGISVVVYVTVLASLDLSLAYPMVSLGYVIVVLMSTVLFRERVSPGRWLAVLIICAGVALVGFAGR